LGEPTEVEVTDPAHPLYGRRFAVHSISRPTYGPGHVLVLYREHMHLRIPLPATDLASSPRPSHPTKLTADAIRQFLALLKEWDTPCPNDPPPSGDDSPQP
jgi:hypothetical protein